MAKMKSKYANVLQNIQNLKYLPVAFYTLSFVVAFFENTGYFYVMGSKFLGLFELSDFLSAAIHEIPGAIIAVTIASLTSLPPSLYQKHETSEIPSESFGVRFGVLGYVLFVILALSVVLVALLVFKISGRYAITVSIAMPSLIAIWFILSSLFSFGDDGRDLFYSVYVIIFIVAFSFASGLDSALNDLDNEYEYEIRTNNPNMNAKILRSISSGVFVLEEGNVHYIPENQIIEISGEVKNVY